MANNETRKRCACGATFVARSSGGVKLTDGDMCLNCSLTERLRMAYGAAKEAAKEHTGEDDFVEA